MRQHEELVCTDHIGDGLAHAGRLHRRKGRRVQPHGCGKPFVGGAALRIVLFVARVSITVPDELLRRSRAAGLDISGMTAAALADELERREKLDELDRYLTELDAELGPVTPEEQARAQEWLARVFPPGVEDRRTRSA